MRVVITGASGFLGRNVLLGAPREWDVVAVYHSALGFEAFIKEHRLAHVRPLRCNLIDAHDVAAAREAIGGGIDAVLYLAANGDPAASTERPRWDLELNTTAVVNFLEHCSASHLVYVSSGAVYDGLTGPVSPSTPVSPHLPYAISKLASERYIQFFTERRQTLGSYVNVRFFGAYGPYEPPRKITTRWLQAMAAGRREFVVRGDGDNLIDFMYIDDAVTGFLALLQAAGTSATVDFGSGVPITVNALVEAMARSLGTEVMIRHEGETAEYIRFRSTDTTMKDHFGVVPTVSFEDGFRRLKHFIDRQAHAQPA